jgi:hypothetical protein
MQPAGLQGRVWPAAAARGARPVGGGRVPGERPEGEAPQFADKYCGLARGQALAMDAEREGGGDSGEGGEACRGRQAPRGGD